MCVCVCVCAVVYARPMQFIKIHGRHVLRSIVQTAFAMGYTIFYTYTVCAKIRDAIN